MPTLINVESSLSPYLTTVVRRGTQNWLELTTDQKSKPSDLAEFLILLSDLKNEGFLWMAGEPGSKVYHNMDCPEVEKITLSIEDGPIKKVLNDNVYVVILFRVKKAKEGETVASSS